MVENTTEEIVSRQVALSLLRAGYPQFNAARYWIRKPNGEWVLFTKQQIMEGDTIYAGLLAAPTVSEAVFWKLQNWPKTQSAPFFKHSICPEVLSDSIFDWNYKSFRNREV